MAPLTIGRSRPSRSGCRSPATYQRQLLPDDPPLDDRRPRRHTEEGIVGEAYAGDEDQALLEIDAIIRDEIAPRLIGEDAFAVERCWELARPPTFDILRDRRLGLVACACVDTAIWDAVGKALGQPLWRLWGGYRDRLPMIAIGGYYDAGARRSPRRSADSAERGLAGMKFKVGGAHAGGGRRALPRRARGRAATTSSCWPTRTRAGRRSEAIEFGRRVEDLDLYWFEEPCRWHNDRRAMRDVRHGAGVPRLRRPERVLRRAAAAT